ASPMVGARPMPGIATGDGSGVESFATTHTAPSSPSAVIRLQKSHVRKTGQGRRFHSARVALVSAMPWTSTSSFTFTRLRSDLPRLSVRKRASASAIDDDQVGHDAHEESDRQEAQPELAVPEAAHPVPDLAD